MLAKLLPYNHKQHNKAMKVILRNLFGVILTTLILSSCASRKDQAAAGLEGRKWNLVSVGGKQAGAANAFIQFGKEAGKINGKGGCNGFGGTYSGDGSRIKIEGIISTRMACDDLDTENAFFRALRAADRYKVQQDTLYLYENDIQLAVLKGAPL